MAASSSFSSTPTVTVLDHCRVSPSGADVPPVPSGEISLPLTFFDVIWLGSHPVERLFFYRWPDLTTAHFVASALPRLKTALAATLRLYYPLAGHLRPPPPGSDKFEIHCTGGDSVPFTLAECAEGEHFPQLTGDHPRAVGTLRPLVPEIPPADGAMALMALQVTVFPGAGVCIGVSIHHTACDGTGFTGFVKAWASACRWAEGAAAAAPTSDELPIIDRSLVSDANGLYTVLYDSMERITGGKWFPMEVGGDASLVRSTFLLRRTHIEQLRHRVSQQRPPPPSSRYTSFVVACAYVWVCLLKAREEPPPPQVGDAAYFFFAVDCRARLGPPLPAAYFGNCLGPCFVDARRSDLVGKGGVAWAAEAIAVAVARLGKDGEVLRDAAEWIPKIMAQLPGRPLSVAGSPRFGVYGVDFGWGRPAKVEVVGIERTGAMALAESREGDGGMEVGLALPATEMARVRELFAAGLEDTDKEA